jgi:hypothetical protein
MTSNTKAILSAAGIATVLATPVMAKTHHRAAVQHTYVAPYGNGQVQTPYAPDLPQAAHNNGINPDFQLGERN